MRELNRAKRVPGASAWTGAWFDVVLKQDFAIGGFFYLRGSVFQARQVENHVPSHEIRNAQYEIPPEYAIMNDIDFYELFKMKEENAMGGELFGYPPEEDDKELREKHNRLKQIAELERKVEELEKKNEVVRREKVAEEYGIVTERHLWSVTVDVPMQWSGKRPYRGREQKSEVLTEGRNMVEAAMAAEAMAKGISEKAYVLSIDYVRVIGAIK